MSPEPRSFDDLRISGLLWLINATVFHPRGRALAITTKPDGTALGWKLLGDGTEPWMFSDKDHDEIDSLFRAAMATLAEPPDA